VQVTTYVLSTYLVGNQSWRCFGGIIRSEVGVFHPCIAMPNLQGVPPFPERKNCFRQVREGDTRDHSSTRTERTGSILSAGRAECFSARHRSGWSGAPVAPPATFSETMAGTARRITFAMRVIQNLTVASVRYDLGADDPKGDE